MKLNRREFVGLGLAAGAAAATPGCRPVFLTQALGSAGTGKRPTGPIRWVNSACFQCRAGCGIRVKTIAGNAIKIEGNPLHPLNGNPAEPLSGGRLCPKGQAGLQVLYDPDRIKSPLRQTARRGDPDGFRPISWDEAIREVAQRLGKIRREEGPQTVAILRERCRGPMRELMRRFARAYGTPNEIDCGATGSDHVRLAHYLTQGVRDHLAYDWKKTNFVISFGASLVESFQPTVYLQRMVAHLRRGRPGNRGKIVTVDPRLSVTASKSDEWIPIRPGTDGALALGMAAVIVGKGWHDAQFIKEHTVGFDAWKKQVLDGMSPGFVSAETGIPVDTIERLAKEFAQTRPSFAVAGGGAGEHSNGLYNLMAVHCLNALVGNIDAPGGVIVQEYPPLSGWPEFQPDATAQAGLSRPRLDGAGTAQFPLAESVPWALVDAILAEQPYKVQAALVYYANPAFSLPSPEKTREALGKIPFVVSFSPFMDDTTAMADLVLPDHTYLEGLQLEVPAAGTGIPMLTLRQPAVEPLYKTRGTGDVILQIVKEMGESAVRAAFPWGDYEKALRATLDGVAKAASLTPDALWTKLLEEGVWSGGPSKLGDAARTYGKPSGKFEFVSSRMREGLVAAAGKTGMDELAAALGIEARGEAVLMPHYERPKTAAQSDDFPLYLNCYKTMTHPDGGSTNQPWLQQAYGVQLNEFWEPWAEINPLTAHELGIRDGEMIWLESPIGKIAVKARLFEGAMPGVINMPVEYGHAVEGRWLADRHGENPNNVACGVYDRLTGAVSRSATKVKVGIRT